MMDKQPKRYDPAVIASLWPVVEPVSSMAEALAQLSVQDKRHELQGLPANKTSLYDWLNQHLPPLMALHARMTGLKVAVCASLWHKQLVDLLFPTLVALRWQFGYVPSLSRNAIGLEIEENGRITTISIAGSGFCSNDDIELDQRLATLLRDFGELFTGLFVEQSVNGKRFWGNLGNALAQGFTRQGVQVKPERATALAEHINLWMQQIMPEFAKLTEVRAVADSATGTLYVRRHTCCLKYKLNRARMCKTCILVDEQEQYDHYRQALADAASV